MLPVKRRPGRPDVNGAVDWVFGNQFSGPAAARLPPFSHCNVMVEPTDCFQSGTRAGISSYKFEIEANQANFKSFFETALTKWLPPSVAAKTIQPIVVPNETVLESSWVDTSCR